MPLSAAEIHQWASAYIQAQQSDTPVEPGHPLWWAIERFQLPVDRSCAEEVWTAILEVLSRRPPEEVLGMLAAGPLEDLIEDWGPLFIDRIEAAALADTAFRHLLNGVWESSTPEIWARVEAARGAVSRDA